MTLELKKERIKDKSSIKDKQEINISGLSDCFFFLFELITY